MTATARFARCTMKVAGNSLRFGIGKEHKIFPIVCVRIFSESHRDLYVLAIRIVCASISFIKTRRAVGH